MSNVSKKIQVETVVKFMIKVGMLEVNSMDGIAVHYKNGNVKEVHIETFIQELIYSDMEYEEMCKDVLFHIAQDNL